MKRVLLQAPGFLGDEVVFTGVVRELKRETGWSFRIQTRHPELWLNHPAIEGFGANGEEDEVHSLDYCPPYYAANQTPVHFLEQYFQVMRGVLGLHGRHCIHKFAGEVGLTEHEIQSPPFELPGRYWVVVAGWKSGVPAKGWPTVNYQEVVDSLRGRMSFVQLGVRSIWHPSLRGVINLVGKTALRELISVIYHAEGVLCPITSIMHLAAAIPAATKSGFKIRPCVVVAGGREAPHYINYPMHRVLSVVGQLSCCSTGGCGKSRFGKGQCEYPTNAGSELVPRCMPLIKPTDVVAAIEYYYRGEVKLPRRVGVIEALSRRLQSYGKADDCILGAEVGAGRGEVSAQLLRGDDRLQLIMVDDWQSAKKSGSDSLHPWQQEAIRGTDFVASRRRILDCGCEKALQEIDDGTLDFVFLSNQHSTGVERLDLEKWATKIKVGGFLAGRFGKGVIDRSKAMSPVQQFASKHSFKIVTDKDNSWFIEIQRRHPTVRSGALFTFTNKKRTQ